MLNPTPYGSFQDRLKIGFHYVSCIGVLRSLDLASGDPEKIKHQIMENHQLAAESYPNNCGFDKIYTNAYGCLNNNNDGITMKGAYSVDGSSVSINAAAGNRKTTPINLAPHSPTPINLAPYSPEEDIYPNWYLPFEVIQARKTVSTDAVADSDFLGWEDWEDFCQSRVDFADLGAKDSNIIPSEICSYDAVCPLGEGFPPINAKSPELVNTDEKNIYIPVKSYQESDGGDHGSSSKMKKMWAIVVPGEVHGTAQCSMLVSTENVPVKKVTTRALCCKTENQKKARNSD